MTFLNQPWTPPSFRAVGGEGEGGQMPLVHLILRLKLRLLLRVVSTNQHIIDTISHLQSNPADGLIFLTGLKSSIIQALLTSRFSLPD